MPPLSVALLRLMGNHQIHTLDRRRSRYIGLAHTHLQHILTATAINVRRTVHWVTEQPLARTQMLPFQALAQAG